MQASELPQDEYHPYYKSYIEILGTLELDQALQKSLQDLKAFIGDLSPEILSHAYADGKWTVAEVLLHLIDAERVFQYRALRFARNDGIDLPGFDQDAYVPNSNAGSRTKESLLEEYTNVRKSSLSLFASFGAGELACIGTANSTPMSVRALGFVISGHQAHHFKILRERYL
ncbi:MAG: DinB family protein [Flavobacteriaceae bacterium]|nr:DinB family protein [Flavobacteriaceae bacterium]